MKCPKYSHEQTCPCQSCQARNPTEKPWKEIPSTDNIACGECGYTLHHMEWFDMNWEEYKKSLAFNKSVDSN